MYIKFYLLPVAFKHLFVYLNRLRMTIQIVKINYTWIRKQVWKVMYKYTYLSPSFPLGHKTSLLHMSLSFAMLLACLRCIPVHVTTRMVLRQVVWNLPGFLFPGSVQFNGLFWYFLIGHSYTSIIYINYF